MTGFVYAIGDSERVKIGWSSNPLMRLVKIKSDCPTHTHLFGMVPATRAQEAEAHKLLARWQIQGEWFRHEGAVAAFVEMLPRSKPKPIEIPKDTGTTSFRSIIDLWPSVEAMTSETGTSPWAIRKWWQRDRIPAEYWSAVLAAPRVKDAGITAELLATLAARVADRPEAAE